MDFSDGNSYNFDQKERGIALLINNRNFKTANDRKGDELDQQNMKKLFDDLGFKTCSYEDQTADGMRGIATEIAQDSIHVDSDCFVCVVASHGREKQTKTDTHGPYLEKEQEIMGVDGNEIKTSEFVGIFSDDKCEGLRGKPKFFFIQACRIAGVLKMDEGYPLRPLESLKLINETPANKLTDSTEEVPMVTMAPCPEDTLIMFASVSGNLAIRNPRDGSWMLQELYKCIVKHRKELERMNFLDILTDVLASLSKKETSAKQFLKQFSPGCFIHCLTKDVFMKEKVLEY